MIELRVDKSQRSFWNPSEQIISLGNNFSPLELGHEIAHARLGHDITGSPEVDLYEERDAWREALRRISPREVRIGEVKKSMYSYLRIVNFEYGRGSPQFRLAKKLTNEVIELAKRRKKEAT